MHAERLCTKMSTNPDEAKLSEFVKDAAKFLAQKKAQKVLDRLDVIMMEYDYDSDEDELISRISDLYEFIQKEFEI